MAGLGQFVFGAVWLGKAGMECFRRGRSGPSWFGSARQSKAGGVARGIEWSGAAR